MNLTQRIQAFSIKHNAPQHNPRTLPPMVVSAAKNAAQRDRETADKYLAQFRTNNERRSR